VERRQAACVEWHPLPRSAFTLSHSQTHSRYIPSSATSLPVPPTPPPLHAQELETLEQQAQELYCQARAKHGHQDKLRIQIAALDERIREAHQR
jgi:uncharacterized protein YkwD